MENDTANPFDEAAKTAADKTNQALAGEEAKITTVSWEALKKKLPDPVDQKNLDQLMQIVNSATDHNEKVAALLDNLQVLGGVIVKVLTQIR